MKVQKVVEEEIDFRAIHHSEWPEIAIQMITPEMLAWAKKDLFPRDALVAILEKRMEPIDLFGKDAKE